jgi:putative hydrolase of the HAD superfamily
VRPLPKALLFDLGGVIVPWVGLIEISRLTGQSEADVSAIMAKTPCFNAYEIGACSTDDFLAAAYNVFDLNLNKDQFAQLWNQWVKSPYDGTRSALLKLGHRFQIACLSNTNESHWSHLSAAHNIIDVFKGGAYASHIIKAAKPQAAAWNITLEDMGLNPKDIWFFDDTMANIDAARKLGIESFHVDRDVGVLPLLRELGLLKND